MTSHELARKLLQGPDLPVVINGWGNDEGLGPFEVSIVDEPILQAYYSKAEKVLDRAMSFGYDSQD